MNERIVMANQIRTGTFISLLASNGGLVSAIARPITKESTPAKKNKNIDDMNFSLLISSHFLLPQSGYVAANLSIIHETFPPIAILTVPLSLTTIMCISIHPQPKAFVAATAPSNLIRIVLPFLGS